MLPELQATAAELIGALDAATAGLDALARNDLASALGRLAIAGADAKNRITDAVRVLHETLAGVREHLSAVVAGLARALAPAAAEPTLPFPDVGVPPSPAPPGAPPQAPGAAAAAESGPQPGRQPHPAGGVGDGDVETGPARPAPATPAAETRGGGVTLTTCDSAACEPVAQADGPALKSAGKGAKAPAKPHRRNVKGLRQAFEAKY